LLIDKAVTVYAVYSSKRSKHMTASFCIFYPVFRFILISSSCCLIGE